MNMKRFMNKKVVAIGLAAGITLGGAGAAFAYFTHSGQVTGSGDHGTAGSPGRSRSVDRQRRPIIPGDGGQAVTITADEHQQSHERPDVKTIRLRDGDRVDLRLTHGCPTAWQAFPSSSATAHVLDARRSVAWQRCHGHTGAPRTATVQLNDDVSNQDHCLRQRRCAGHAELHASN